MALISCPECGKQISDKASSCPNCGTPIAEKKVKVHFFRKKSVYGVIATGTVFVDGVPVGSASSGSEFDVMLSVGSHNVVIESRASGMIGSGRSNSTMINIPSDAKSVDVEMKPKTDANSFFGGGGPIVAIEEVNVRR